MFVLLEHLVAIYVSPMGCGDNVGVSCMGCMSILKL